ncbi:cyclase family protein [Modestobacter sp. VKM Ac-2986]|uniref:cyclase family protein n=1 Tax=Modestobacter sp. VKM Ac-2986 TaxID=3004140 RepID=UPI0022AA742B|nr:cyclase family protein [Modestobacter sp. VKM Ac-2986]MCZ2828146.1 cyclase family protein [Modestobacter sp. VKM Ac-2986]
MRLIDLSHVVEHGMTTYPGLPAPEIGVHLGFEESHGAYAAGTEFQIGRIAMVANTGTYLDTPAHRYRDGHDLAGLPLERCAGLPAVVVRAAGLGHALDTAAFTGLDVAGCAVLVHTGWDAHWGTEAYLDRDHPHLTEDGARALVDAGATLVGIDSVNIDDTLGTARPAHSTLLAADIPVVEHLTGLGGLPDTGAVFTAVPVAVRGLATFPVRAFASLG